MNVLDLFSAAAGGWSLGMHRAGYRTMAACEVIPWRRALYSQNNPGVPVYDDVTTLTAERLIRDIGYLPDVVVGSPPCQDISSANTKGQGVDGERSKLYFEAVRLVDECRPRWFALENSANLRTRGADRVIDALEAIGYTCWPFVVSAGDIGANHPRKRSWLIGFNARDSEKDGRRTGRTWGCTVATQRLPPVEACGDASVGNADGIGRDGGRQGWRSGVDLPNEDDINAEGNANTESFGHEGGRAWRYRQDGGGSASVARWNVGDSNGARRAPFRKSLTSDFGQECATAERAVAGGPDVPNADGGRQSDCAVNGEMGGCEGFGSATPEPWADWNSGLAHHLRVDDGLSGWVAKSRVAIGGPRGTVAASLIVEAFGDAVVPQIPEAIGRAIARVEAALAMVANDNQPAALAA